jgi:hypothetical protein
MTPSADAALVARLRRLGRHVAMLESPEFSFGDWAPVQENEDGSINLPWYQPSPAADQFLGDVRALVTPFDWPAWAGTAEGQSLIGHPDAIASATADQLQKLLTAYVRRERFGEGTLAEAFDTGVLSAIARRAGQLADELDATRRAGG